MDTTRSTLQEIHYRYEDGSVFSFFIKRDDKIDEHISGNKWRKLKYALAHAKEKKAEGILTFGGAFSNHLVATAKACKDNGLKSIGMVRGEELNPKSNATLQQCTAFGMELVFISREAYSERNEYTFLSCVKDDYKGYQVVPEGGAGFYGVVGCQEIVNEIPFQPDVICLAAGTGATAAGILLGVSAPTQVVAVLVLKGDFMQAEILKQVNSVLYNNEATTALGKQLTVVSEGHFGGYGKWDKTLLDFITDFYRQTGVKLDPIYTGKAVFALLKAMRQGQLKPTQKVVFVHTGGLQGIKGVEERIGYSLF